MSTENKTIQEQMFELVEKCQSEPTSIKSFCRSHKIKEHIYYYWQHKYRQQTTPSKFIPIEIKQVPEFISADVTISYPNGINMTLTGGASLSVLKELASIS